MYFKDNVVTVVAIPEAHPQRMRDGTWYRNPGTKLVHTKRETLKTFIKYCGRSVDESGVQPNPDQVAALQN